MRLEVIIPDQLYNQAQRAADKTGVSFDRFITDAVSSHIDAEHDGPSLTPELLESLRRAEAEIDAGRGMTMAQVDESLAARRAAWLQRVSL